MTFPSKALQNKNQLPSELADLSAAIQSLPLEYRAKIEPFGNRVIESTLRRKRILSLVQEALSQLRLDMKYLMFDLEATRRERDTLRTELDSDSE